MEPGGQQEGLLGEVLGEVECVMGAYRQARLTWGLLGTPVRKVIGRIIEELSARGIGEVQGSRRSGARIQAGLDVHVVTHMSKRWCLVPGRIVDVSEGGVGLRMRHDFVGAPAGQEPAGKSPIQIGTCIIVGFGARPNTVWVPAEIIRCDTPSNGEIRVGARFATARSLSQLGHAGGR